jgi:hypothetical protein
MVGDFPAFLPYFLRKIRLLPGFQKLNERRFEKQGEGDREQYAKHSEKLSAIIREM